VNIQAIAFIRLGKQKCKQLFIPSFLRIEHGLKLFGSCRNLDLNNKTVTIIKGCLSLPREKKEKIIITIRNLDILRVCPVTTV